MGKRDGEEMTNQPEQQSIAQRVHVMAVSKGWWNDPLEHRVPRLLDWLLEEVEEAREAYLYFKTDDFTSIDAEGLEKPEGFGSELADLSLIIDDLALGTGIDLDAQKEKKLAYNLVRKYKRDYKGDKL